MVDYMNKFKEQYWEPEWHPIMPLFLALFGNQLFMKLPRTTKDQVEIYR